MRNISKLILLAVAAISLTSCEKEMMGYEGMEGVYFAVQSGAYYGSERNWPYVPYTDVNFMDQNHDTVDVGLKVMITGETKTYDRTYGIAVDNDSTTAKLDVDYLDVPTLGTIKAGEDADTIHVRIVKTDLLDDSTLTLGIKLIASDQLGLSFPSFDAVSGYTAGTVYKNFDASKHTIRFTASITRPKVWTGTDVSPYNGGYESGMWGAFSKKKLELMCKLFDLTYKDFSSTATMPMVLQTLITKKLSAYLIQQYNNKTPVLEDDGRLMWCEYCPWQSKIGEKWVPGDDYYNN